MKDLGSTWMFNDSTEKRTPKNFYPQQLTNILLILMSSKSGRGGRKDTVSANYSAHLSTFSIPGSNPVESSCAGHKIKQDDLLSSNHA